MGDVVCLYTLCKKVLQGASLAAAEASWPTPRPCQGQQCVPTNCSHNQRQYCVSRLPRDTPCRMDQRRTHYRALRGALPGKASRGTSVTALVSMSHESVLIGNKLCDPSSSRPVRVTTRGWVWVWESLAGASWTTVCSDIVHQAPVPLLTGRCLYWQCMFSSVHRSFSIFV